MVFTDGQYRPIAYLLLEIVDDATHIEQVSVHRGHARRGIGRLLMDAAAAWARQHSSTAMTLTTDAEVPWNGPYYRRLGFDVLAEEQLGPGLQQIRSHERASGLDEWPRIAMRRPLDRPLTTALGGLVRQVRPEPALHHRDVHTPTACVVRDLFAIDSPDGEVTRRRVGEQQSAHRGRRGHGK